MPVPIAVIIAWISVFESTLLIRFFSALMILPRSGRIAWYERSRRLLRRAAGGVALDEEELGRLRVVDRAVGELAGQRRALERRLAARQLARLARRLARARRGDRLRDDLLRVGRVLLEELGELLR